LVVSALESLLFTVYETFEVALPEVEQLIERKGIERTAAIFNHLELRLR
jgi:hypothetical protein